MPGMLRKHLGLTGRASLGDFARWFVELLLLSVLIEAMAASMPSLLFVLLPLALWLSLIPLMVRRYHDLGLSGRPVIWLYGALIAALAVPPALMALNYLVSPQQGIADDGRMIGSAIITAVLFLAAVIVFLVYATFLCINPSQPGANRYGPNPNEVPS